MADLFCFLMRIAIGLRSFLLWLVSAAGDTYIITKTAVGRSGSFLLLGVPPEVVSPPALLRARSDGLVNWTWNQPRSGPIFLSLRPAKVVRGATWKVPTWGV